MTLVPVGKAWVIIGIHLSGVELQRGHTVDLAVGDRRGLMLGSAVEVDERIVGRDRRSGAERGLHQAGSAGACAACAAGRAARACAGSASAESADATARSSLHHAGVDAAKESSGLRAKNIRVRDGKVVASDRQIEIVFEREIDGILQRKVEFAVAHELVKTRRIRQRRFRNRVGSIGIQGLCDFGISNCSRLGGLEALG